MVDVNIDEGIGLCSSFFMTVFTVTKILRTNHYIMASLSSRMNILVEQAFKYLNRSLKLYTTPETDDTCIELTSKK